MTDHMQDKLNEFEKTFNHAVSAGLTSREICDIAKKYFDLRVNIQGITIEESKCTVGTTPTCIMFVNVIKLLGSEFKVDHYILFDVDKNRFIDPLGMKPHCFEMPIMEHNIRLAAPVDCSVVDIVRDASFEYTYNNYSYQYPQNNTCALWCLAFMMYKEQYVHEIIQPKITNQNSVYKQLQMRGNNINLPDPSRERKLLDMLLNKIV